MEPTIAGVTFAGAPNYYQSGGGGGGAYGSVPVAPPITTTQPGTTAQAIQSGQLAYNQLPGYNQSLKNIGQNIQSLTAGQIPQDVLRQIQQTAAERGIAIGSPGSPNTNANLLESVGDTSLKLQQMGQNQLLSQLPALPGGAISQNPNFYVNPQQQYERDLQASIFRASPNPAAAAAAAMAAAKSGYAQGAGSYSGANSNPNLGAAIPGPTQDYTIPPPQVYGALNPTSGGSTGSSDPYAAWSDWWTGGSPSGSIINKYSDTVAPGGADGTGQQDYGYGDGGYGFDTSTAGTDFYDENAYAGDYGDNGAY